MQIIQIEQITQDNPASRRLPHDKRYEKGIVYSRGKCFAPEEPVVPIGDLGFSQSDATYEVAVVSRGRFFRLQDHFERFARSSEKFRLTNPHSEADMQDIFNALLRSTGLREAGILWIVTRGLPKPGAIAARDRKLSDAFEHRFYASVYPYASLATQEQRNSGLNLLISKAHIRIHPRAVDPTAKNFHWMDMKLALFEATDQSKEWSVLTDADGYLTECPGANIFALKRGELYTPDSGCLHGITRRTALEFADMLDIPTHVEKVHANQLVEADDAFVTSSAGGIIPVNSVDSVLLGGTNGPGELAVKFHNMYWEKIWSGWKCTPVDYESAAAAPVFR